MALASWAKISFSWYIYLNCKMDEDEQDVYVAQLHEVFDSCDHARKGFLNRNELVELCKKLQLDDQVPQLLQQLLGSVEAEGQVWRKIYRIFVDKLRTTPR